MSQKISLPTDPKARKQRPVGTGVLDYFPKALAEVAYVSYVGNVQHNGEGTPLHWDRSKSSDESDALIRHFLERGKTDSDGTRHSAKLAWRALALLEKELEAAELPTVDLGIGGAVPTVTHDIANPAYPSPDYCYIHKVYLDDSRICPADPSSALYQWWLAHYQADFDARRSHEHGE